MDTVINYLHDLSKEVEYLKKQQEELPFLSLQTEVFYEIWCSGVGCRQALMAPVSPENQ